MPRRSSKAVALRGVYEEPYRINGHRVLFAVDDKGEQVALRTVPPGGDVDAITAELWTTLDHENPILPAASFARAFRLIRGGLPVGLLALSELAASLPL